MRLVARIRMALLSLFRRGHASAHLDDELRYHLDRQISENIAAGMSPESSPIRRPPPVRQSRAASRTDAGHLVVVLA